MATVVAWLGGHASVRIAAWVTALAAASLAVMGGFALAQLRRLGRARRTRGAQQRVERAADLLRMFAEGVLPAALAFQRQLTDHHLTVYNGPVTPSPEAGVAERDEAVVEKLRLAGAIPALNQLELFAAMALRSMAAELVDEDDIYQPLARLYTELCDDFHDVLSASCAAAGGGYAHLRQLQGRWDGRVSAEARDQYAALDPAGRGSHYAECTVLLDDPAPEGNAWHAVAAIQARDPAGRRIAGWPIRLSFQPAHEGEEATVEDVRLTSAPAECVANTSGTICVRLSLRADPRAANGPALHIYDPAAPSRVAQSVRWPVVEETGRLA